MDLSLDDLIKKNKKVKVGPKKRLSSGTGTGTVTKKQAPKILGKVGMKSKSSLLDARSKIIQKRRVTIRDAREKIAENTRKSIKDARELISKKKPNHPPRSLKALAISRGKPIRARKPSFDSDELMNDSDFTQLRRTVRNEIYRSAPPITMPKLPSFNINQDLARMSPDPFDCYVVPTRRPVLIPPIRTERLDRTMRPGRPMNAHMDAYVQRKPILRPTPLDDHDDRFSDDRYISVSKEGVRSRLYNESGRDRNESAGIFAKLPVQGTSLPSAAQIGHRIIVSNLHESVSESDVRELFEDVGALVTAHLVRPGIAEVVYKNLGDAEEAVEIYHNRQLDGQPMKCLLVRSGSKPSYSRL